MKNVFPLSWLTLGVAIFAVGDRAQGAGNAKLNLGDPVPEVSAANQDGQQIDLPEATKTGYALVYFYPKAMTPGCTAQACSLRDDYQTLQERGVKVFGVSADSVADQKKFKTTEHLPFDLLSDSDHRVTQQFGVPLTLNHFASRQAYLFKNGKLVWFDLKASTSQQAKDVLAAIAKNQ